LRYVVLILLLAAFFGYVVEYASAPLPTHLLRYYVHYDIEIEVAKDHFGTFYGITKHTAGLKGAMNYVIATLAALGLALGLHWGWKRLKDRRRRPRG